MTVSVSISDSSGGKLSLNTAVSNTGVGEKRCAVGFNPAQDTNAQAIKVLSGVLMERLEALKTRSTDPLYQACLAEAQRNIETGCMYGVKAQFMD